MTEFFQLLEQADKSLTLGINSLFSDFSDPIWVFFSNRVVWAPLYVAMIALLIWRLGWKKGLISVLALILTIVCVDQFCNLIKDWAARYRPCNDKWMLANGLHVLEAASEKYCYGFFSGHAANAGAFALGSALFIRHDRKARYRWYYISIAIWAFLIGLSRIFVGKHFAGDVLVGFAIGPAIGYGLYALTRYIWKKTGWEVTA